jgi:lipoprotein-anchoring transpeptidase ErfK/SrfK
MSGWVSEGRIVAPVPEVFPVGERGATMPRFSRRVLAATLLVVTLIAAPTGAFAASGGSSYVVQWGDTLAKIAAQMGVATWTLAAVNGIQNIDRIYPGQVLVVPGESAPGATENNQVPAGHGWIDINLSEQWLTAYEGDTPVFGSAVSTGIDGHYTPTGEYAVEWKLDSETMEGADYYLPDVPYVMYFADFLAIHGTYWHDNFGTPMSHGCVNLPTAAAAWLYSWASIGTPVNIHY